MLESREDQEESRGLRIPEPEHKTPLFFQNQEIRKSHKKHPRDGRDL